MIERICINCHMRKPPTNGRLYRPSYYCSCDKIKLQDDKHEGNVNDGRKKEDRTTD